MQSHRHRHGLDTLPEMTDVLFQKLLLNSSCLRDFFFFMFSQKSLKFENVIKIFLYASLIQDFKNK